MDEQMIIALVSILGTGIGSMSGIMFTSKLNNYRIEQLEKKLDEFNRLNERLALAEQSIQTCHARVDKIIAVSTKSL